MASCWSRKRNKTLCGVQMSFWCVREAPLCSHLVVDNSAHGHVTLHVCGSSCRKRCYKNKPKVTQRLTLYHWWSIYLFIYFLDCGMLFKGSSESDVLSVWWEHTMHRLLIIPSIFPLCYRMNIWCCVWVNWLTRSYSPLVFMIIYAAILDDLGKHCLRKLHVCNIVSIKRTAWSKYVITRRHFSLVSPCRL